MIMSKLSFKRQYCDPSKGLVTNYGDGGLQTGGGGGHVKFYPMKKGGGAEKV